ncbi:hypothetical protein BJX70DRAFT_397228 [Aspergillus crustosus]
MESASDRSSPAIEEVVINNQDQGDQPGIVEYKVLGDDGSGEPTLSADSGDYDTNKHTEYVETSKGMENSEDMENPEDIVNTDDFSGGEDKAG